MFKDEMCDLKVIGRHFDRNYMGDIYFKSPRGNISISMERITVGKSVLNLWNSKNFFPKKQMLINSFLQTQRPG